MAWIGIGILAVAVVLLVLNHESGSVAGLANSDFARLASGAALMLLVGSGLVFSYRGRTRKALRDAAAWLAIALAIVTAYALRDDAAHLVDRLRGELQPGYAVERVRADGRLELTLQRRDDGHFGARVTVNGHNLNMLVDTGASVVILTFADAGRAGIDTSRLFFDASVMTTNGRTLAAPVRLDRIAIGGVTFSGLPALVAKPDQLNENLLGINFLNRFESYEVRGDTLVLRARAP